MAMTEAARRCLGIVFTKSKAASRLPFLQGVFSKRGCYQGQQEIRIAQ